MRRRPQEQDSSSISIHRPLQKKVGDLGIVLSGGGSRAAYQAGALRALAPYLKAESEQISVIVGSSIGAVNGLIVAACLKHGLPHAVDTLSDMWMERSFRNSFSGSPSGAFFKAIQVAVLQYLSPGPNETNRAVFNPAPLMEAVDKAIEGNGGLSPEERASCLNSVAVMTTIEGSERKPLLFVSSHREVPEENLAGASFDVCKVRTLTAKHGFASAALPSILPPVEIDTERGKIRLVDGGISINVPIDPAARLGAQRLIVLDISGRNWWLDRYSEPHDTRPTWEVPSAEKTYCLRPPDVFLARNREPMGPLLKYAVGASTSKFIAAVGPIWPLFTLIKKKLGEDIAYEVMSYVALDQDYAQGLLEQGYNETTATLKARHILEFEQAEQNAELQPATA